MVFYLQNGEALLRYKGRNQAGRRNRRVCPAGAREQDEKLLLELKQLKAVNKTLQYDSTTIDDVRVLFDGVIAGFPVMEHYLSEDAAIYHSPAFETALVKVSIFNLCQFVFQLY